MMSKQTFTKKDLPRERLALWGRVELDPQAFVLSSPIRILLECSCNVVCDEFKVTPPFSGRASFAKAFSGSVHCNGLWEALLSYAVWPIL
jgi:hypothetical protein